MLLKNEDGTHTAGPYDLMCIQHDEATGRYHVALYEEKPLPGPVQDRPAVLRLKSKMHHYEGAEDFPGALVHLAELREEIHLKDEQVWEDEDRVVEVASAGPDVMAIRPEEIGA